MTQAEQGEAMHEDVNILDFSDREVRQRQLRALYDQVHQDPAYDREKPKVFRTPGTFLFEYATGALKWEQIEQFLKDHPDALCTCMDERLEGLDGKPAITSHEGCGAAGAVFGMLKDSSSAAYKLMLEFVGDEQAIKDALATGQSDEIGKLWSRTLATKLGYEYRHLTKNHEHHHTSAVILDAAGLFHGNTMGEKGAVPFVVSNTEFLGNTNKASAMDMLAQYGRLALTIARGDHSILPKDQKFSVVVTTRDESEKQAFQAQWDAVLQKLPADNYELVYMTEEEISGR